MKGYLFYVDQAAALKHQMYRLYFPLRELKKKRRQTIIPNFLNCLYGNNIYIIIREIDIVLYIVQF